MPDAGRPLAGDQPHRRRLRLEKPRLAAAYRADLVDMEAAAIARLALMREIPLLLHQGGKRRFHATNCPISTGLSPADGQFD